jgi:hypothetical protein
VTTDVAPETVEESPAAEAVAPEVVAEVADATEAVVEEVQEAVTE